MPIFFLSAWTIASSYQDREGRAGEKLIGEMEEEENEEEITAGKKQKTKKTEKWMQHENTETGVVRKRPLKVKGSRCYLNPGTEGRPL